MIGVMIRSGKSIKYVGIRWQTNELSIRGLEKNSQNKKRQSNILKEKKNEVCEFVSVLWTETMSYGVMQGVSG